MAAAQQLVYLNGEVLPAEQARVSVDDRAFTFADGIYEVIRVYGGQPFELKRHMRRLCRSAEGLRLSLDPPIEEIESICGDMVARQGLAEAAIYVQVSRGTAPRAHPFPDGGRPTTLVRVRPAPPAPEALLERGASAISVPDDRWARCDLKTVALTANVLAKQRAADAGAYEALFVRDGFVTDGASTNVFAVFDGVLRTAPESNYILAGITREVTLDLARSDGLPVEERPFRVEALEHADELFLTATTTRVLPVTRIDARPVGSGAPGCITRRLMALFDERCRTAG